MSRAALLALLALPLVACGGRVDIPGESSDAGVTPDAVSDSLPSDSMPDVALCTPDSCGPAPGAPAELCWDGSLGGNTGRCIRMSDGTCGWEFRDCPPPRSCTTSAGCGEPSLYCKVEVGACGKAGTCARKPEGCPGIYAPVCGCDGKTYGNECDAASQGASVLHSGECGGTSKTCTSNAACTIGQYCRFVDGKCPVPGAVGSCAPKPSGCPDVYAPVCGCDGRTYGNSCEAATAGQTVAYKGECADAPTGTCGGFVGVECPAGQWCDYPPDWTCGGGDGTGTCRSKPTGCSKEYKPVCACDGKTYGNACQANLAGHDVMYDGACK